MPPPSPVWTEHYVKKKVVFFDAEFWATVRIDGIVHQSKVVVLKVKGAGE